ncbi:response regulator transcription factor [Paenibacillus sp. 1-18]|uniref:response regulator transcription factor n=1 Tax=Paenibacillus sp. 1-18 TaxID=1333846 RepID=UPI0004722978|nr:response regulator transcription factor [Paenibacillus sp. 1-18]
MHKIFIIESDENLCKELVKALTENNLAVEFTHSGQESLLRFSRGKYISIVLDVKLNDIDGFEVLQKIRTASCVPVLMLNAKNETVDNVCALRLGADDYMTKPFERNEFVARVQSLIRRYTVLNNVSELEKKLFFNSLEIDPNKRVVVIDGRNVELKGKEFDILFYLAQNCNRIYTKKQIYEEVWKREYMYDDNNIMSHISKIRKKIEKSSANIQNIKGVGYRFVEHE